MSINQPKNALNVAIEVLAFAFVVYVLMDKMHSRPWEFAGIFVALVFWLKATFRVGIAVSDLLSGRSPRWF